MTRLALAAALLLAAGSASAELVTIRYDLPETASYSLLWGYFGGERGPTTGEILSTTLVINYTTTGTQDAADFYFRARGLWAAHSKTIPRRLRAADAAFAARFTHAFDALFNGKRAEPAAALVAALLDPFGGFLFEGFRQEAKKP